ncbi:hypothetical protein AABB24_010643 [Solanum stoloniferum]|uniref:Secreted protein n=1 Tax=Solanum stoloniferum TaxID=62892 RepID=A0ABD2UCG8_9SOLN
MAGDHRCWFLGARWFSRLLLLLPAGAAASDEDLLVASSGCCCCSLELLVVGASDVHLKEKGRKRGGEREEGESGAVPFAGSFTSHRWSSPAAVAGGFRSLHRRKERRETEATSGCWPRRSCCLLRSSRWSEVLLDAGGQQQESLPGGLHGVFAGAW